MEEKFILAPAVRLTLVNPKTWDYKDIVFRVYNTPIGEKWLTQFKKLKSQGYDYREKSFKVADQGMISSHDTLRAFNQLIKKINKFYDQPITPIDKVDEDSLNYLHEQYEIYGSRLDKLLQERYWDTAYKNIPADSPAAKIWPGITFNEEMHFNFIKLNEMIHDAELVETTVNKSGRLPGGVITSSLNPRSDYDLEEEDYLNLVQYPMFGDLCLGYNTLGKNLQHIVLDEDFEAVERNAVFPQVNWSDELYIHLNYDAYYPNMVRDYKHKWDKLEITEKLGYRFGDYITNREGYIKIGEIEPSLLNEYYDRDGGILIDFTEYNTVYDIDLIPLSQIKPEKRYPDWKKPVTQVGPTIEKIENNQANIVTWVLNDICTYNCRYCPPALHNGKNHKYDWDQIEPFLDKLFEQYGQDKPLIFSISGGEPTLSPFFPQLVKKIYENGGYTGITSNLARTDRFIEENFKYLIYACCSFHPAMEFPNKTDELFIEKIKSVEKVTFPSVRIMMDPLYWDETIDFINRVENETTAKIELVYIEEQYGNSKDKLADIPYSKEQLEFINNFKVKTGSWQQTKVIQETNPLYKRPPSDKIKIFFEDETTEIMRTPQTYINNGQTNFFDYMCKVGKESMFIHQSGRIRRGNCMVGGQVGTIENWKDIDWNDLARPLKCSVSKCHCGADVQISKWKI